MHQQQQQQFLIVHSVYSVDLCVCAPLVLQFSRQIITNNECVCPLLEMGTFLHYAAVVWQLAHCPLTTCHMAFIASIDCPF